MSTNKKRIETAKKIVGSVLVMGYAMQLLSFVGWYLGLPEAPLMAGINTGLMAAAVGFYVWKARRENELKITLTYGKEKSEHLRNGNGEESGCESSGNMVG